MIDINNESAVEIDESVLLRLTQDNLALLHVSPDADVAIVLVDELILLTTHGLLHLLGYDHAEPEDEREMFGLQRELISAFAAAERRRTS